MGEAPLRTEYNNMSVTSYEFLIITRPSSELRNIRAEGGRGGNALREGRSPSPSGVPAVTNIDRRNQ